MEKPK